MRFAKIALVVIIVVIVSLTALYGSFLFNTGKGSTTSLDSAKAAAIVTSLAFAHWRSIAQRNLSVVMSEYSTEYEAVWWNVNGSKALEAFNGKNDCNIPTGPGNCSRIVSSVWAGFFNATSSSPSLNFTICDFKVNYGENQNVFVTATVWFYLSNPPETIRVPYDIDFRNVAGTWLLERDWFGFPETPAQVMPGLVRSSCT